LLLTCIVLTSLTTTPTNVYAKSASELSQKTTPQPPKPAQVLKAVRSTVVDFGNNNVLQLQNRDITDFANDRGENPDVAVRNAVTTYVQTKFSGMTSLATVTNDPLAGDADIWVRGDLNIAGKGTSYLISATKNTKKLEAWSVKINVNGQVNSGGNLNIKYTLAAYDKVASSEMIGWSGCAVIEPNRTTRYAIMDTDHKMYKTQDGSLQRQFTNRATLEYGCLGDTTG
jgi:hypothetical protein